MNKKQIIIATIIAAVSLFAVFNVSFLLVSLSHEWAGKHKILSEPMQIAVNASAIIQRFPACIFVMLVVGGISFVLVWLLSRLFGKHESAA